MARTAGPIASLLTPAGGALVAMAIALTSFATHTPTHHKGAADPSSLPPYIPRLHRERPLIAVLAYNASTEVTDFVVPYGILVESGVADVVAVAMEPGPIQMSPALQFEPQATTHVFDSRFPDGADFVIVPNIYNGAKDPAVLNWIKLQANRGATIVGICDGVPVLANAGLLDRRSATGHWRTIDGLERNHPGTQWVRNRRYVADGNVITTSGVSASIPISVALVEAIGGRQAAERVAKTLGVADWSPTHNSEQFKLSAGSILTLLRNKGMFWRHELLGLEVRPGVDEISVALVADAYARTRRSSVIAVAGSQRPIVTRRGLTLVPDRMANGAGQPKKRLPLHESLPATQALDTALEGIAASYGKATADFVALTMEYPQAQTSRSNRP